VPLAIIKIAMAIDLALLWDFHQPEASEPRFRDAHHMLAFVDRAPTDQLQGGLKAHYRATGDEAQAEHYSSRLRATAK
jgi:hypothetical protein